MKWQNFVDKLVLYVSVILSTRKFGKFSIELHVTCNQVVMKFISSCFQNACVYWAYIYMYIAVSNQVVIIWCCYCSWIAFYLYICNLYMYVYFFTESLEGCFNMLVKVVHKLYYSLMKLTVSVATEVTRKKSIHEELKLNCYDKWKEWVQN